MRLLLDEEDIDKLILYVRIDDKIKIGKDMLELDIMIRDKIIIL